MLAATPVVWAQDSITFVPAWKISDHYSYVLSRLRQDYTNDTLYSTTSFDYDISLTLTKAEVEEKEITLTYKGKAKEHKILKKTPDKYALANALDYLSLKIYGFSTMKVVYTVDASGAFIELKNKTELRNYISSVLNAVKHEQGITPDFKGVLEQLKPSLLSDDYIVYSFLPEIHFYHLLYGTTWAMGKQKSEIEVPDPLTGEALPGILSTEVKKIPAKKIAGKVEGPFYDVVMQQQVDQEKLSRSVSDRIEDTQARTSKEDSGAPLVDFSIAYKYTVRNDIIKKASYIKTVVSAESRAVEEFIIK